MSTKYERAREKMSEIVTNGYDKVWQRTRAQVNSVTKMKVDKERRQMKVSQVKLEYNWFEDLHRVTKWQLQFPIYNCVTDEM